MYKCPNKQWTLNAWVLAIVGFKCGLSATVGVTFLIFPEYETQRLALRQLSAKDADAIFSLFSNRSVIEYYDMEAIINRSEALAIIDLFDQRFIKNSGIRWGLYLKKRIS